MFYFYHIPAKIIQDGYTHDLSFSQLLCQDGISVQAIYSPLQTLVAFSFPSISFIMGCRSINK